MTLNPAPLKYAPAQLKDLDDVLRADCSTPSGERGKKRALALAFSGGLDSRFLAFAAHRLGYSVMLLHVHGPHVSPQESAFARNWAALHTLPLTSLFVDPLEDERIVTNDKRRCYFCKKHLFEALLCVSGTLPLCDGTHASDTTGYRPGRMALRELGIHSPLETAGFKKDDIRRVGSEIGMDMPWQKARPCLLTRFPYGVRADAHLLHALAEAEEQLAALLNKYNQNAGLSSGDEPDFRVRITALTPPGADVEIHIQEKNCVTQSEAFLEECRHLFHKTSPLRLLTIRYPKTLSGYFDKASK